MKLFGLIGFPLEHSFSKKYFDKKFEASGQPNTFELFPIKSIELFPDLVIKNPLLKGLAVTIPYKVSVMKFLDELDISASSTGAVNCIKLSDKITGYNTDVIGFERSFLPLLKIEKENCLVLGNGGASKAVTSVLKKNNIKYLQVSRDPVGDLISYPSINEEIIKKYPAIINCTSLGMFPDLNSRPDIPYEFISSENILFDLVYNPELTSFLSEGKSRGAKIKNGLEMLYIQAEENWKIWNE